MEELDFSQQITEMVYPIEQDHDSLLGAERFGGKKRSELKDSDFLDPKRRSFPIVDCKNVKAAVSTWGLYKGPMSFETFKSKLKSKAKAIGCEDSIPATWAKASDDEESTAAKTKKQWEKIDKKELKKDTKKEKGEHEKDAIEDDKSKIKKLKKGKPSTKKSVETHDLKKDEELDEADKIKYTKAESDKSRREGLEGREGKQDQWEMRHEDLHERLKHHQDAVKNLQAEIKALEKDRKEDLRDVKKETYHYPRHT